jgi:hypothetical protein
MMFMTGSPDDFTKRIDVLALTGPGTQEGMLTLVLGEQLHCPGCGRLSTRWEIPATDPVPQQEPCEDGRPDPGE